jgi:hypothetical protein
VPIPDGLKPELEFLRKEYNLKYEFPWDKKE